MSATDYVATVRLVDYSPVIHAITEGPFAVAWEPVTWCGRDAAGYVTGEGQFSKDVTCRICRRAWRAAHPEERTPE